MRLRLSSDGFLEFLGTGAVSVVCGAWFSKTLGFGSAVLLLALAIALHLLSRIMGNKALLIVVFYGLGVYLAVQHGWTSVSFMPGRLNH